MSQQPQKRILGMTYWQIGILIGVLILCFSILGCFTIFSLVNQAKTTPKTTPTPAPTQEAFIDRYGTPPTHEVRDYWDNGKGTNFAYFIVANKYITRQEAETLITYYKEKHKGFKLINIYIYCDGLYADVKYWDAMGFSGGIGDEVFKHIMYWYQTGEWSSSGVIFMTEPNVDYPTFGTICD